MKVNIRNYSSTQKDSISGMTRCATILGIMGIVLGEKFKSLPLTGLQANTFEGAKSYVSVMTRHVMSASKQELKYFLGYVRLESIQPRRYLSLAGSNRTSKRLTFSLAYNLKIMTRHKNIYTHTCSGRTWV